MKKLIFVYFLSNYGKIGLLLITKAGHTADTKRSVFIGATRTHPLRKNFNKISFASERSIFRKLRLSKAQN